MIKEILFDEEFWFYPFMIPVLIVLKFQEKIIDYFENIKISYLKIIFSFLIVPLLFCVLSILMFSIPLFFLTPFTCMVFFVKEALRMEKFEI